MFRALASKMNADQRAAKVKLAVEAARRHHPAGAMRDFAEADAAAWAGNLYDGLNCETDDHGNEVYTVKQGLKAAVHGRQDVAAALIMQHRILELLYELRDAIRFGSILVILILGYIAYKIS